MPVAFKHVLAQGPSLRTLGKVALAAFSQGTQGAPKPSGSFVTPTPWVSDDLPPRSADLVRAYVRNVGGDPAWYRNVLPPTFFPQWTFPTAARTLEGIPYPLMKIMNAGCRIEANAPLPINEPIRVKARLRSIDDDGRRVLFTQEVITGTPSAPEALVCEMRALILLPKPKDAAKNGAAKNGAANGVASGAKKVDKKARPSVPSDAREIGFLRVGADAGLDFAKLTGDFNPIHWVPAWARASGFRSCILHGFGTLARAVEAMNRTLFAGDVGRLRTIDVRFTRPLVLPARVGVYVKDDRVWVGDALGGGAYLEGTFTTNND